MLVVGSSCHKLRCLFLSFSVVVCRLVFVVPLSREVCKDEVDGGESGVWGRRWPYLVSRYRLRTSHG
jgi:hypothetical protein